MFEMEALCRAVRYPDYNPITARYPVLRQTYTNWRCHFYRPQIVLDSYKFLKIRKFHRTQRSLQERERLAQQFASSKALEFVPNDIKGFLEKQDKEIVSMSIWQTAMIRSRELFQLSKQLHWWAQPSPLNISWFYMEPATLYCCKVVHNSFRNYSQSSAHFRNLADHYNSSRLAVEQPKKTK